MDILANTTASVTTILNLRNSNQSERHMKEIYDMKLSMIDKIFIALLCSVICMAGVCGNCLVIYKLGYKAKGKQKRSELLFTLLAVADLISSVSLPVMISQRYLWGFDSKDDFYIVCYASETVCALTVTMTECILILICMERYRGITAPLSPQMKGRSVAVALLMALFLATVITVPYWMDGHIYCAYLYTMKKAKVMSPLKTDLLLIHCILLVTRDLLAMCFLSFFIARMVRALKNLRSKIGEVENPKRLRKFRRAKNLLLIVIVAFAICSVPANATFMIMYALFHSKYIFSHADILPGILRLSLYFRLLLAVGSVTNPIIYTSMLPCFAWYRSKLMGCLRLRCCKRKITPDIQKYSKFSCTNCKTEVVCFTKHLERVIVFPPLMPALLSTFNKIFYAGK